MRGSRTENENSMRSSVRGTKREMMEIFLPVVAGFPACYHRKFPSICKITTNTEGGEPSVFGKKGEKSS